MDLRRDNGLTMFGRVVQKQVAELRLKLVAEPPPASMQEAHKILQVSMWNNLTELEQKVQPDGSLDHAWCVAYFTTLAATAEVLAEKMRLVSIHDKSRN